MSSMHQSRDQTLSVETAQQAVRLKVEAKQQSIFAEGERLAG